MEVVKKGQFHFSRPFINFNSDMIFPIGDIKLEEEDFILLRRGGTGFASGTLIYFSSISSFLQIVSNVHVEILLGLIETKVKQVKSKRRSKSEAISPCYAMLTALPSLFYVYRTVLTCSSFHSVDCKINHQINVQNRTSRNEWRW